MTRPEMRPLGVGEVLDRAFQVLRQNFGTLVTTSLLGFSPMLVLYLVLGVPYGTMPADGASAALGVTMIILFMLMMLAMAVVWAGMTHQVDRAATGGTATVGDGLRAGGGALFRVIGAGIMAYLALLGLFLPVALVGGILAALGVGAGPGVTILVILAVAIPAILAVVVWMALAFLILPALVIEGLGPLKAMRRANELAKGGRLRVCATAFLSWLVVILPSIGIPFLLGSGAVFWDPQAAGQMSVFQLYLYQAVTFGVSALTTPFMVAVMVYTYYDRRVRREGYDVELASASIPATV